METSRGHAKQDHAYVLLVHIKAYAEAYTGTHMAINRNIPPPSPLYEEHRLRYTVNDMPEVEAQVEVGSEERSREYR